MTYHEIIGFIGLTVSLRYKFTIKQWVKITIDEEVIQKEIKKEVENNLTGIIVSCSDSYIIFLILDDEEDHEFPIKIKNILSIDMVKNEL